MAKFICTVCGYVYEGDEAPAKCPQCGVPASKFKKVEETEGIQFIQEHVLGVAKGCDEEMLRDLRNHFNGECSEVANASLHGRPGGSWPDTDRPRCTRP